MIKTNLKIKPILIKIIMNNSCKNNKNKLKSKQNNNKIKENLNKKIIKMIIKENYQICLNRI